MGRKKKENSYTETVSFRITKEQKEVLEKNKWIKDDLRDQIRDYISMFIMK